MESIGNALDRYLQYKKPEIRSEFTFWFKEIMANLRKDGCQWTEEGILFRFLKNVKPCNTAAIKSLHEACKEYSKENYREGMAYKNYSHAFFAKTKVVKPTQGKLF